jgi:tRNA 2-selenouridine synthase
VDDIVIKDWNRKRTVPIDVRSPIEFQDGHIPGAVNIPLFTNEERALIGTIYKIAGKQQAQWKSMEIVSPKIPEMLSKIKKYQAQGQKPLLYCWRGGSRSGSVSTFAELAGLETSRLFGGYRAYREWVLEELNEQLVQGKTPVILHGMTGIGKTMILHQLATDYPTVDLEHMANHRGSIFGEIGLSEPHNQKMFDSLFLERLLSIKDESYMIMEAESRRIGKVGLPDFFMEWRTHGIHFLLKAPLPYRVNTIMKEYVWPNIGQAWFQPKVADVFQHIKKRLKPEDQIRGLQFVKDEDYEQFIELMLVKYYDSRYQFHDSDYTGELIEISFESMPEAVDKIKAYLDKKVLVNV